jgi:hypothetical protein
MRRNSRTIWPSAAESGGSAVRNRKTLASLICLRGWPTMRGSMALIYAAMSGSSGMSISLHVATAALQLSLFVYMAGA